MPVSQTIAVVVIYFDSKKCKVTDALLDIVEVDEKCGKYVQSSEGIAYKEKYTAFQHHWVCE